MEIVNVNANCPMRDPMGDVRRYEYLSSYYLRTDEKWQKTFADVSFMGRATAYRL